jgi:hypothetical protein
MLKDACKDGRKAEELGYDDDALIAAASLK